MIKVFPSLSQENATSDEKSSHDGALVIQSPCSGRKYSLEKRRAKVMDGELRSSQDFLGRSTEAGIDLLCWGVKKEWQRDAAKPPQPREPPQFWRESLLSS